MSANVENLMLSTLRLMATLWLVISLAGCGFQLRQSAEIPPEVSPMYVQANDGSKIAAAMREALISSGIEIAADAAQSKLMIRVLSESESSRVVAVNADGKVIANELIYSVRFDAASAAGSPLTEAQTVELRREHVNPENEVLGKAAEEELIRTDMIETMTGRIFDRLKAQLL
jgi:LPS-assembly lipoprotein